MTNTEIQFNEIVEGDMLVVATRGYQGPHATTGVAYAKRITGNGFEPDYNEWIDINGRTLVTDVVRPGTTTTITRVKNVSPPKFKKGDKVTVKYGGEEVCATITGLRSERADDGKYVYTVYPSTRWGSNVSEEFATKREEMLEEDVIIDTPIALRKGDRVKSNVHEGWTGTIVGTINTASRIVFLEWDGLGGGYQSAYREDLTVLYAPRETDGSVKNAVALKHIEELREEYKADIEKLQKKLYSLKVTKRALLRG